MINYLRWPILLNNSVPSILVRQFGRFATTTQNETSTKKCSSNHFLIAGSMDDIRGIINSIVKGCAQAGLVVPDVLAGFVARTVSIIGIICISLQTQLISEYFPFLLQHRLLNRMHLTLHWIEKLLKKELKKLLCKVSKSCLRKIALPWKCKYCITIIELFSMFHWVDMTVDLSVGLKCKLIMIRLT